MNARKGESGGVRAALCPLCPEQPVASAEQEKPKRGRQLSCRACVASRSLRVVPCVSDRPLASVCIQQCDSEVSLPGDGPEPKKQPFLRSVLELEQLRIQLPAKEAVSPAGQEQEIGFCETKGGIFLRLEFSVPKVESLS